MVALESPSQCSACGAELSLTAPGALCPKCLLRLGLSEELAQTKPEDTRCSESPHSHSAIHIPQSALNTVRYFGDYELLGEIARGGMGIVFRARQVSLNRVVALKLVSAGALATEDLVKRFRAEAEAAASLSHPNIVPIYEVGEHLGQHYFSMGLIEGLNLREALSAPSGNLQSAVSPKSLRRNAGSKSSWTQGSRPANNPSAIQPGPGRAPSLRHDPREAARLLAIIARAVHFAHERGVLHRDLKPSNILLDTNGQPHLTDFGLAKLLEKDSTLTHTHAVLGTPAYMAPEQARGDTRNVTTAVDVYGLGAVLYEMLAGRPPFSGTTSMETIQQVLTQEPRRLALLSSIWDRDLETVCLKCLEKEPKQRYTSAAALAEDLERWMDGRPICARRAHLWERTLKWAKRKPAGVALAAVSGLAIVALIGALAAQIGFQAEQRQRKKVEAALGQAERARSAEEEQRKQKEQALRQAEDARKAEQEQRQVKEAALVEAEQARKIAEEQRRVKEAALVEAERARQAETEARAEEARQRRIAEAALAKAEKNQYFRRIAWAQREWEANNVEAAEQLLDECPSELRQWEWHYLKRLYHAELRTLTPFTNSVQSVAVTPDGHLVAAVSPNGTVKVWDTTTDLERVEFRKLRGVARAALHPAGTHLAVDDGVGAIESWDLRTGIKCRSSTRHGFHVTSLQYSQDGRELLSASSDGTILVSNTATGELVKGPFLHGGFLNSAVISPDLQFIASAGGRPSSVNKRGEYVPEVPGVIKVWEAKTGTVRLALSNSVGVAYSVAFSPNGTRLASTHADGSLRVWDVTSGRQEFTFRGHLGDVLSVAFSSDGDRLISGGADRTVRVWMLGKAGESVVYRGPRGQVNGVAFIGDGRRALSASGDGTIRWWDVSQPQEAISLRGGSMTIAFSPDGKWLVSGSNVWNLATFEEESSLSANSFERLAFSPDAKLLAKSSRLYDQFNQGIQVWTMEGHALVPTERKNGGYGIAFSPDGQLLASWTAGTVQMWDPTSNTEIDSFAAHASGVWDLAFSPNGKLLALATGDSGSNFRSGGKPGEVQLWDWKAHQLVKALPARRFAVWGLAFSKDGKRLASSGGLYMGTADQPRPGEVLVWDAETGEEVFDLPGVTDNVFNVAFSPDGKRLVAASGGQSGRVPVEVRIWDMETGLIAFSLHGFDHDPVHGVAFSPDGKRIATVGRGKVRLFGLGRAGLDLGLPSVLE